MLQTVRASAVAWTPLADTGDRGPVGEPVCKLTGLEASGNHEMESSHTFPPTTGQVKFKSHEGERFECSAAQWR